MFAQVRLGIEGGLNLSRFIPADRSAETGNDYYKTAWFRGEQIGLVAETRLSQKLFLKSGLHVNAKGTILKTQTTLDTSRRNIEVHYAEVPLVLLYKSNAGKGNFVYGGIGFYAASAIRGFDWGKGRYLSGPYSINSKVIFANENPYRSLPMVMKPFDWGLIGLAGFEYKRFQLSLGCEIGLSQVLPNSKIYGMNFRNMETSFSAAYYIFSPNY